jgi:hypothetical protein
MMAMMAMTTALRMVTTTVKETDDSQRTDGCWLCRPHPAEQSAVRGHLGCGPVLALKQELPDAKRGFCKCMSARGQLVAYRSFVIEPMHTNETRGCGKTVVLFLAK